MLIVEINYGKLIYMLQQGRKTSRICHQSQYSYTHTYQAPACRPVMDGVWSYLASLPPSLCCCRHRRLRWPTVNASANGTSLPSELALSGLNGRTATEAARRAKSPRPVAAFSAHLPVRKGLSNPLAAAFNWKSCRWRILIVLSV